MTELSGNITTMFKQQPPHLAYPNCWAFPAIKNFVLHAWLICTAYRPIVTLPGLNTAATTASLPSATSHVIFQVQHLPLRINWEILINFIVIIDFAVNWETVINFVVNWGIIIDFAVNWKILIDFMTADPILVWSTTA